MSALPDPKTLDARKAQARAWFERLRDEICAALEALENELPAGAPMRDRDRRPFRAHAVGAQGSSPGDRRAAAA